MTMTLKTALCLSLLGAAFAAAPPTPVYDVTAFGARADGKTNDAGAIQKAIDACTAAGGGTVLLPPGNYLSGTIVLKSNVTLRISAGATLWGSRRIEDYKPYHLVYAEDSENIAIEGDGTINGNGDAFWTPEFRAIEPRPSPLIRLAGCRNVHVRDIRIRNTPGWGIHPWECDGVWIRGISMITDMRGPNTDGIDPDSSRNVFISDSYIEGGDDAICPKTSSRDKSRPALPTENLTVTNCVLISDDSAIKLGTASHGDFRNLTFSNTVIRGSHYGLTMYIKDGARVENVHFSNISIDTSPDFFNQKTNSRRTWTEYPIFLDLEKRADQSRVSSIRDVSFSDISIRSKGRILVGAMPESPMENVSFRNVTMRVTGYEAVEKQRKPRGVAKIRPSTPETDYAPAPAAMIFANVRGLSLRGARVVWDTDAPPQDRHAIYAAGVEDLVIEGFEGGPSGSKLAAIGLENVKRTFITGARPAASMPAFVGLVNTAEDQVTFSGNALPEGVEPAVAGAAYQHRK